MSQVISIRKGKNYSVTVCDCKTLSNSDWVEAHQDIGGFLGVCYFLSKVQTPQTTIGETVLLALIGGPFAFLGGALIGNIVAQTSCVSYPLLAYLMLQQSRQK